MKASGAQIGVVRAAFASTKEELQWAHEVLELAQRQGGAFAHAGQMVDEPVLARARTIIDRCGPASSA